MIGPRDAARPLCAEGAYSGAVGGGAAGMTAAIGLAAVAADQLTKSKMSPEFREQVSWLLDSQHGELVSAVAESRGLDEAGAKDLIDGSPYGDDVAVEKHAVDRVIGEEELPSLLDGRRRAPGRWPRPSGRDAFSWRPPLNRAESRPGQPAPASRDSAGPFRQPAASAGTSRR